MFSKISAFKLFASFLLALGVFIAAPAMTKAATCSDGATDTCGNNGSFYNMGSPECDIIGSDIEWFGGSQERILGGQSCDVFGNAGGDFAGYRMEGTGQPNNFTTPILIGGATPPSWTYAKTGFFFDGPAIPNGEIHNDPYYVNRFFGGPANVFVGYPDDDSALTIGSYNFSWTPCDLNFRDVTHSGCPSTTISSNMPGSGNSRTINANPGDPITFTVNNRLRPNGGSGTWGTGSFNITLGLVTTCYTKAWYASIYPSGRPSGLPYRNYHPTASQVCTPDAEAALDASPAGISSGGSTTITWSCNGTGTGSLSPAPPGFNGSLTNGQTLSSGSLGSTTTYNLTCTNAYNNATASKTVTVTAAPTASITASPTSVTSGNSSTISWTCGNSTSGSVSPTGWSGTSGSQNTGALSSTKTYTLTCSASGQTSATASATVTVSGSSAPTATLTGNGTTNLTLNAGQSLTTAWSSTNATAGSTNLQIINNSTGLNVASDACPNFSGSFPPISGTSGSPGPAVVPACEQGFTYKFTYTVTGPGGSASAVLTVVVPSSGGGGTAPTASITASPTSVTSGNSSTISWTCGNSTSGSVSPTGWSGTSGSQNTGALSSAATYTVTCSKSGFPNATASATVTISGGGSVTCSPLSQTVAVNNTAVVLGSGGTGTYFWNAGGSSNPSPVSSSWSGSYPTAGTYTVIANSVANCTINVTGGGGGSSDLTITDFHMTDAAGNPVSSFAPNAQIYPSVTIRNNGPNPTSASGGYFYISFTSNRASAPPVNTSSDVNVYITVSNPIAAGASKTYSYPANNADWAGGSYTMPVGSYTGWAYVDSFNYVSESNENNNVASVAYSVSSASPAPAIQLSKSTMSFSGVSGSGTMSPASDSFTVKNSGAAGSTLKWHATTDTNWCSVSGTGNGTYFTGANLAQNALSPGLTVTVGAPSNTGTVTCHVIISDNGSSPAATNSPQQIVLTYTVQPSNASGISASLSSCPSRTVDLSWTAAQTNGQPVTYNIYGNTVNNSGSAALITNVSGTSYSDSPPTGSTYYYWVEALSGGLNSPNRVASVPAGTAVIDCPVNQNPVAVSTISINGSTYSNLVTVTSGVPTPVYLSAIGSSDPDGWTNATLGMSGGGAKCEWNSDLNQGVPTFETTKTNPAAPSNCNISLGSLTFNDPPGTYTYQVLKLTDRAGGVSAVSTVQVTVIPGNACTAGSCGTCVGGLCGGGSSNAVNANQGVCPANGVVLNWTAASGATSYNIYRAVHGGSPVLLFPNVGNVLTITDSTVASGTHYDYWVEGASSGLVSPDKVAADSNSSSGISPNACQANLDNSDKDFVLKNNQPIIYPPTAPGACSSATDPLPTGVTFVLGDIVGFSLNVCNTSNTSHAVASNIVVTDTMINMKMPQAGWGAKYKGSDMVYDGTGNSGQPNHYSVSGSEPDQVLTFNIPGTLVANDSGSITFQVQLKAPDGTTGSNSRFQNTFVISYNNGSGQTATPVRRTPFVQFSLSNPVPDINEIR